MEPVLALPHGGSVRYNRGTLLHPYTCKMSEHRQDRHSSTSSGHAAARHRFGQAVLLFPNVQKLKPVKNNFTVYFSDVCLYFSSGSAGDTGLYADKMSEHRPDRHPSTSSGHAAARHRFGQAVLLFPNVQKLKPVKNNFTVYFSDICR